MNLKLENFELGFLDFKNKNLNFEIMGLEI